MLDDGVSEKIMHRLRRLKPRFSEMGIKRMRVFGSVARGEARSDSDVDLIVDLDRSVGLIEFAGIKRQIEESLDRPVDLVTERGLHRALKQDILSEARDV